MFRGVAIFVLGTLSGPFIVQWFASVLPAPKIIATVQPMRITRGNPAGCTAYEFSISATDAADYLYLKLQFPEKIGSYKVGFPAEDISSPSRPSIQAFEIGKNADGQCNVVQAAVNNDAGITSSAVGNVVSVSGSKLPPSTAIIGIAVANHQRTGQIYAEGAYEYTRLGQAIRKPLPVSISAVSETK
jgi:hypothetical protein